MVDHVGVDLEVREIAAFQVRQHRPDVVADLERVGRRALPRGTSALEDRERPAFEVGGLSRQAEQALHLLAPNPPAGGARRQRPAPVRGAQR